MGGLAFSAAVSLLIVPMFYVWFDDLNLWRRRVLTRTGSASPAHASAAPLANQGNSTL
jgi:hypothetical protein